jgi:hypothetical protein
MTTQSIKAADNPSLANGLINQAMSAQATTTEPATIIPPSDTLVHLPGGYISDAGEVIKTAEVRELTGRDEEIIAKSGNPGRVFSAILGRGVVSVGNIKATEAVLDNLLAGDRDALMLGIYKATFGNTATVNSFCAGCNEPVEVEVNVDEDIKSKVLVDPKTDRTFTVSSRKHEYLVTLPNGAVQREISTSLDKSMAELTTILLQGTVLEIDGRSVLSPQQVLNMGVTDRRDVAEAIAERASGPKFEDTTVACQTCGGEVEVPISLGTLFRF